ncbi:MAG: hypothetical protein LUF89_08280 [Ruminococcus sp.]|nr:hypothetical protein [Ruminococcus sp.]
MWSCSNCGKINPDDAVECKCGFRHQVRADSMDGVDAIQVHTKPWTCPVCHIVNDPLTNVCECGHGGGHYEEQTK